ncbi:hypothetical protein ACWGNM_31655 [Streptomyces sp. NPDC055796]
MSETTPNSKGPAPVRLTPEATEPKLIPADQVKPEDIGTLSLRYIDGAPVLVVSGGTVIPVELAVVDPSGNAVGAARVSPGPTARLNGTSVKVPVPSGSLVDLVLTLK